MWWYCGEGVVLICACGGMRWYCGGGGCGPNRVYGSLLWVYSCVRLDFAGRPACSHICHLGIVGIGSLVLEH